MGNILSKRAANYLAGNPRNTAVTSQGLGPIQLVSNQLEPNNGNEARIYQVPAADAPQDREQSIHKAVNISQDVDPVKYIPYLPSAERVTQQHKSLAKTKDNKTSAPKAVLQQATSARPTAEPCDGVKGTAGQLDALKSDILQDVHDNLSQQQPTKHVQHQREQQENRWMVYGYNQHMETTEAPLLTTVTPCDSFHNISASVQVPAQVLCKYTSPQVECSCGSKEQQEVTPQLSASTMQTPVHRPCKGMVRGENLCRKEAETQRKTKIDKSPSQRFNCVLSPVSEESTDLTCQVTDKSHDIAKRSTTTKLGISEVSAAMPSEPTNHSRQITEVQLYFLSAKSESYRGLEAKMRLRQKLANKMKAQSGDGGRNTAQESPQQQGGTTLEENTTKNHNEPHQSPQLNKSDNDACIQKVMVKAPASLVPAVEGLPRADSHKPTTDKSIRLQRELMVPLPQDTAVKPKTKCTTKALNRNQHKNTGNVTMKEEMNGKSGLVGKEEQEPAIGSVVTPASEGRWHPFTVNQSCPHKARCRHNPGTGLPPNVQNWFKECPNHLRGDKSKTQIAKHRERQEEKMRHSQYTRLNGQCVGFGDI